MSPVMAVVKAAGGSRRCSGKGERGGGDEPEGNLAKHFKYSPIWLARGRCCVPAHQSDRPRLAFSAPCRIVFQECFVARDLVDDPFDPGNHVAPSGSARPWPGLVRSSCRATRPGPVLPLPRRAAAVRPPHATPFCRSGRCDAPAVGIRGLLDAGACLHVRLAQGVEQFDAERRQPYGSFVWMHLGFEPRSCRLPIGGEVEIGGPDEALVQNVQSRTRATR